jgi:hypothetical protein
MTRTGITRRLAALALATVCLLPIARVRADVVTDWNVIALNATAVPPNSILQSRTLAIVHGAIYDAARAVDRKSGAYAIDIDAPAGTSVDAAVVAAAHGTLVRLAPAERQMLDAALNVSLSKIADGQGKTEGTALGQQIAEKLVALRSTDGAAAKVVFTAKPGVGLYQFTPPHSLPAILAQWGSVTPFVLRSSVGLDLKGAPALTDGRSVRARLRGGQECGRAQQHDADCGSDRCSDFLDRADGRPLARGRPRGIRSQGFVAIGKCPPVCSAVDGQRRLADHRLRGKIQPAALAADHRHSHRNGSEYRYAQGAILGGSRFW